MHHSSSAGSMPFMACAIKRKSQYRTAARAHVSSIEFMTTMLVFFAQRAKSTQVNSDA